ncbi:MAG: restriction endonuclease [Oleispira sp.]
MSKLYPDWQLYERLIAKLMLQQLSTSYCVTPNANIVGSISGIKRQIDVLIDYRFDTENRNRIIIDAKKRTRKIDIKDVETFKGLMEDVDAAHGYLVSTIGYTKAAIKRAQELISLKIVPIEHLDSFDLTDWPKCKKSSCSDGHIFWDGFPCFDLELVTNKKRSTVPRLHYVGKCEKCNSFHVKCMECNETLPIPEDDEEDIGHQCSCRPSWAWLASIEEDGHGKKSAELHCIFSYENIITVSRRSL